MKRRDFIKTVAAGSLTSGLAIDRAWGEASPDVVLELTAAPDAVPILTGEPTSVLRFSGRVLEGRPDALRPSGSYLGPLLDLRRGERVRVHFENRLNEASIIHWHGLIVPERADGHPRFAVPAGRRYTYEFTVVNPAATYLYHPHPHGRTGFQVYGGLAGVVIVREPKEEALGLPSGPEELVLVIQDRRLDGDNQLVFSDGMMDSVLGVLGDTILVNGEVDAAFAVSPRAHRLRILNASNARIYKLGWSDGRPLRVIGTDNGLLSRAHGAERRPYVMLGPTERVEVLEDFAERAPGTEVALVSQPFDPGEMEMGMGGESEMMGEGMMSGMTHGTMGDTGGMMGMMRSTQGREMLIARFAVRREQPRAGATVELPADEPSLPEPRFELKTALGFRNMQGFLNGRTFEMQAVASDERVVRGTPIGWTFEHEAMGTHMAHPMHIHGTRFRIVERQRSADAPADVAEGLIDSGYKDTVLVFHGERVRVVLEASEPGLFMYHCHNLEHEDGGMMRNYLVES